jgi:hypothetical protein
MGIPTAGLAVIGAKVAGGNAPIAETSRIRACVTSGGEYLLRPETRLGLRAASSIIV